MILDELLRGYLIGWLVCLGIALGCMSWLALHVLTGGVWGWPMRRRMEAGAMTLPVVAVCAVPLMVFAGHLFPWANHAAVAHEPLLQHREPLYRPGMVIVRWAVMLAVWCVLAVRLRRLSLEHDRTGDVGRILSMRSLSAAWLVVHFLTMSLGAVDWIASREVDWYSSAFGMVVVVGQCATALAVLIIALAWREPGLLERSADPDRASQDWGNLLQTSVVLWSYISFAQFLVIWIGNTQEDVTWFFHRNVGGWKAVTASLIVLHFAAPFVLLLFQGNKRSVGRLAIIAAGVLVMRVVDNVWMVVPSSLEHEPGRLSWADVVVPLVMLFGWWGLFELIARRQPRIPRAWTEMEGAPAVRVEVSHG